MLPATSMASALAAFTAQNYGAGRAKAREDESGIRRPYLCGAGVRLFSFCGRSCPCRPMIGIFTDDGAVIP